MDHMTVDADAGRLEFMQVHKNDEGAYTCTAVNAAGNDSHTAQIVVRGRSTYLCYYSGSQCAIIVMSVFVSVFTFVLL